MAFDPFAEEITADPYPVYRWFRDHQPLAHHEGLDVWFVFRFSDVLQILHDDRRFISGQGVNLTSGDPTRAGRTLISLDNPEHGELRSAISSQFTPRAVSQFEPRIRAIASEHVDAFAGRGSCELMSELAIPVPIIVVGDLLGVRPEDRAQFRIWADDLVHQNPLRPETRGTAKAAAAAIGEYFAGVIAERRSRPKGDLVSTLLAASVDGAELSPADLLGFAFLLIVAGTETTTNLVGNAASALDAEPDQRRALADDPSLMAGAVEEILRWDAPVQGLARVAVEEVEIAGGVLPAGARVQLRFGSANRDEREFAEADRFDIRRSITRHVGLGHGIHYCLGASLSRLEGRVILEELVRRVPDWSVERVTRHPSAEVRGPASLDLAFSPGRPAA